MLAWPRVHKAADWTGVESRFGPHFPAVEGRKVDNGIAAFAWDVLRAFKRVLPVNFVRVCIVFLIVSVGLSYVRTLLDVI